MVSIVGTIDIHNDRDIPYFIVFDGETEASDDEKTYIETGTSSQGYELTKTEANFILTLKQTKRRKMSRKYQK